MTKKFLSRTSKMLSETIKFDEKTCSAQCSVTFLNLDFASLILYHQQLTMSVPFFASSP